jgi:hypothetical protein
MRQPLEKCEFERANLLFGSTTKKTMGRPSGSPFVSLLSAEA